MPTRDMGTVRAFVGDGSVDVFFPKGYDALKGALKGMKGRWNPDRRCWTVESRWARMDGDAVVGRIEESLMGVAPEGWAEAVTRFGGFACASRRYGVKVGVGGIRIELPQGHPSHWVLKALDGAAKDGESWLLPSRCCVGPEVAQVLQRVVAEDMKLFVRSYEHLAERTLRGVVPGDGSPPEGVGIDVGRVVYADHAFIKVADPQIRNEPIHAWPFRVLEAVPAPEPAPGQVPGLALRLAYLEPGLGYRAVRHRMAQPEESRSALLDVTHAHAKWAYKIG